MATLVDASRRALYDYVRRQDHPVGAGGGGRRHRHVARSRGVPPRQARRRRPARGPATGARRPAPRPGPGAEGLRGRRRRPRRHHPGAPVRTDRRHPRRSRSPAAGDRRRQEPRAPGSPTGAGSDLGAAMRGTGAGIVDALAGLGFEPDPQDGPSGCATARSTRWPRGTPRWCAASITASSPASSTASARPREARLAPRPGACCVELTTR